jgi:peptide/nickel transport system permease protein
MEKMKRFTEILRHRGSRLMEAGPSLIFAWAVFILVLVCAVVPGLFTRQNPVMGTPADHLLPPSPAHPLGTDALGRDSFARVVYGASHSLSGAFIAVASGLLIGTTLGLIAGSLGGKIEDTIMRGVDVLLSIPRLLLSLSVIVILGFGSFNVALAVGLTSIASFARLARSEVVKVRRTDYVEAAFGSGGSFLGVLLRHILPNSITSVIAFAALQYGSAILQMSTLGFLGYGAPPPIPEWGLLIAEGRNYVSTAWWLTTAPGLAVVCTVLSLNRISRSFEKDIA